MQKIFISFVFVLAFVLLIMAPKSCQTIPATCNQIFTDNPTSPSGLYQIDPRQDGTGFQAYCDMTTDGGGWTFFAHVNQNYGAQDSLFASDVGTYQSSRADGEATYSKGVLNVVTDDAEIMVTLDSPDPTTANNARKIVFFRHSTDNPGFNGGPLPCSGLSTGFEYKTQIGGNYIGGGTTNSCNADSWYTRTAGNADYLVLFHVGGYGNYWGTGMGGNNSWNHDGWWYFR